jgi:hypothetical protein
VAGPSQAGCALACAGAGALLLVQSTGHHHHRQPRSSMWRSPLPSSSCVVIALLLLAHAAKHAAPSPVAGLPPIVFSAAFAAGGADQPLLRTPKRNGEEEDHRRENDRQDDSAAACLRGPYPGETPGHATAAVAAGGGVDRGDRRLTTASSATQACRPFCMSWLTWRVRGSRTTTCSCSWGRIGTARPGGGRWCAVCPCLYLTH